MATIKTFEELDVWQKARALSKEIYAKTRTGSFTKDFELKDQITRSSGSIADNIAEGFERNGNREFVYFLSIAKGSAGEVRSQLYRAFDRKHIEEKDFYSLKDKALVIIKMISALRNRINSSPMKGSRFQDHQIEP